MFEPLKRSFEVSRGALRLLLAQYLKCHPQDLAFSLSPWGKPSLAGESHLRFNVAHTADLAVYAFAVDCELGVDVEQVQEVADMPNIAGRFFSKPEALELMSVGNQFARQDAFLRCWTRKEAYLKAIGTGLSMPLNSFQVTLLRDDPPRIVQIENNPMLGAEWTLQHLEPVPGYVGALAYHSPVRDIVFRRPLSPRRLLDSFGYRIYSD